ncbi:hypothetical protein CBLAS_0592 [Campylobacter blaseri]|uniref:Uncharacterized protein n=1 Tax=Campylobacter blaseri TaxID=2042961 RepID=A0A2P8R063_9BACT|nr:hypothetical protein [Campylobacter blaseri]PSM51878.1 hypothetical protein CQ405_04750 [Campylobacter blaseri]PSM53662.1 hypothetical protein CRN67_04750 [Campylobacter blaseri]QKF85785.1 hypothetical protein CBLAS_0592 [Campylobacter blaseri]
MRKSILFLMLIISFNFGSNYDTSISLERQNYNEEDINSLYNSFCHITKELEQDKNEWIKEKENCKDQNCIKQIYLSRIKELNTSLQNLNTFPIKLLNHIKDMQKYKICRKYPCKIPTFEEKNFVCKKGYRYTKEQIKSMENFWNDFFKFKDISIKDFLINKEKYNSEKVKKILGKCWNFELDRDVRKYLKTNEQPAEYEITKDRYKYVSIAELYLKGKKFLYIKPVSLISLEFDKKYKRDIGHYYLIDKEFCKKRNLDTNLIKALLNNTENIRLSNDSRSGDYIAIYKNNYYLLELEYFSSGGKGIAIYDLWHDTSSVVNMDLKNPLINSELSSIECSLKYEKSCH